MNLYVIGWNLPGRTRDAALAELTHMTEIYPQLSPATRWSHSDSSPLFLASMYQANEAVAPREYVHADENQIVFFSGLPIAPGGGFSPHRAGELVQHWDQLPDLLEGQYVLVRASLGSNTLELITDFIGLEKAFYRQINDAWLISNSALLIERITGKGSLDPMGVSIALSLGNLGDNRTTREEIKVIPGGQIWRWTEDDRSPQKRAYFSPSGWAHESYERLNAALIRKLSQKLIEHLTTLNDHFGTIQCSLTGGRDSRVLAALLHASGLPGEYRTAGDPESADVRISTEIAHSLDLHHRVSPTETEALFTDWGTHCFRFVRQNDGLISLWQIADTLNQATREDRLEVFLWGAGGEIGRAYHYEPSLFVGKASARRIKSFMGKKLIREDGGLIREEANSMARAYIHQFVDAHLDEGFRPLDIPDLFDALEQLSNWFGHGARNSTMKTDLFSPFCTRPFLNAVFSLSPLQRFTEPLHFGIVRQLSPVMHAAPFDKYPWRLQHPQANLLSMLVQLKVVDLRKHTPNLLRAAKHAVAPRAKMPPAAPKMRWFERASEQIRVICLDQSSSPIWNYVDRTLFEQITSPLKGPQFSYYQRRKIFDIATLFYLEADPRRSAIST